MKNINVHLRKILFLIPAIITFILLGSVLSNAQDTSIDRGITWLLSTQNLDGSWSEGSRQFLDTYTALESLLLLKPNNAQVLSAINWVSQLYPDNTDDLSNKALLLSMAGRDTSLEITALLTLKSIDSGWRVDQDFPGSDVLDTALALQALKAVNYSDQAVIQSAIDYLLSTQNPDGGFGFYSSPCSGCDGDDSNVYMTAMVINTLSQFNDVYDNQIEIDNAVAYLMTKQNPDGGFCSSSSTVYETAISLVALIESGQGQAQPLQNAINYLISNQSADGSWLQDPYSTALALRALATVKPNLSISSNDISFSNPTPTVGETITITANVHNTGPAEAPSTSLGQITVQFYDGDPSTGGTLIEETTIASISAYGAEQTSIDYTIPTASSKTIFVKIDPLNVIDELDETDNIASKNLTSATLPDLSITSADIEIFPPAPDPYIMVGIFIKVRNHGETDATKVLVEVYDGDPAQGGVKLPGSGTIETIPAGGVADAGAAIAGENVTGLSKDIYVVVDPQNTINESNETNNTAVKTFRIGASIDLAVSSSTITFNPTNPKEGDSVTITSTVTNSSWYGYGATAYNITVRFYLGDPDSGGAQIGNDIFIPEISTRGTATVSTTWDSTGHIGNNNIYVCVDPDNAFAEDNENNNKAFKTLKVVTSQGPDLTLTSSDITFSPQAPLQGDMVTITANIRNTGNQDASNVLVGFSLGDPEVSGTTTFSFQPIQIISQGNIATVHTALNTAGLSGTYEIYVNADPLNEITEINEANNIAQAPLEITVPQGPDLKITAINTTDLTTNNTLEVSGNIKITIENKGNQDINTAFEITVFEDRDKNEILDGGTDNILGIFTYTNTLSAGTTDTIDVPVSGNVLFRDNLIYIIADSGNKISELDETNNTRHTSQECEYQPPVRTLNPVEKWSWTGGTVMPNYNQVMHMPVVARIKDTNGDGLIDEEDIPAVIFISFTSAMGDGVLRAVRGDNGQEIFTVTDPLYRTLWCASMAVGDIDNDGLPEIVAARYGGGLIVFENDGTYKWHTIYPGWIQYGGPAIADIDEDGNPEIIIGNIVFNSNGTLKWQGSGGAGYNVEGALSLVANVDMTGHPEIVAGNTVYRSDGTILWRNGTVGDGFNAVANLDEDPYPEIALVGVGKLSILEHTGQIKLGPQQIYGGGRGGAPVIADFNGDGKAEIGVAGGAAFAVYKPDNLSPLWLTITHDYSSMLTGATVFDLAQLPHNFHKNRLFKKIQTHNLLIFKETNE